MVTSLFRVLVNELHISKSSCVERNVWKSLLYINTIHLHLGNCICGETIYFWKRGILTLLHRGMVAKVYFGGLLCQRSSLCLSSFKRIGINMVSKNIFATNGHTFATTNIITPSPPQYPTSVIKGGLPRKNVFFFLWTLFLGGFFSKWHRTCSWMNGLYC